MLKMELLVDETQPDILVLRQQEDGRLTISKADFIARFEGAKTFEDYCHHENCTEFWLEIFADWNDKGYYIS